MGDGLMPEHLADYQLWQESELRAVAGGSYLNPVTDLVNSGRELVVPEVGIFGSPELHGSRARRRTLPLNSSKSLLLIAP